MIKIYFLKLINIFPRFFTLVDYFFYFLLKANKKNFLYSKKNLGIQKLFKEVEEKGFFVIENFWDEKKCNNCIRDFKNLIKKKNKHLQHYPTDIRLFGAEHLSENISNFANDLFLELIANVYMNETTVNVFTLINRVKKEKSSDNYGSGGSWHKDSSFRQLKAFLYLCDVNQNNGPLQLIEGSHKINNYLNHICLSKIQFRSLRINEGQVSKIIKKNKEKLKTFVGKKGTLIIADTACIHRGKPPQNGKRYVLTNYYLSPKSITKEHLDAFQPVNKMKILKKFNEN